MDSRRVEYYQEADAIYVWLRDLPYAFGVDLDHARHIDDAEDEKPIGIELLNVSRGVNLGDLPERAALRESHLVDVRIAPIKAGCANAID
jgi:uncharacterized protein YuzE